MHRVATALLLAGIGVAWLAVRAPAPDRTGTMGTTDAAIASSGRTATGGGSPPRDAPSPFAVVTATASATVSAPIVPRTVRPAARDADPRQAPARSFAPEHALDALLDAPLSGERETALLDGLRAWSDAAPVLAARWIERTIDTAPAGSSADALRHTLLDLWLEVEPASALARLDTLADPDERPYLLSRHAIRLADARAPTDALVWAATIADERARHAVTERVLGHWLERDPGALATRLESALDGTDAAGPGLDPVGAELGERLIDALVARDPARALDWAERLPAERAAALRARALDAWLASDRIAARDRLDGILSTTGTLPAELAGAVPARDRDFALDTWFTLEAPARETMVVGIVESWSREDPGAARSWLDALAEPSLRARAARAWIEANAAREPIDALADALRTVSGAIRPALIAETAATLAERDPRLLEDWLASVPLDDGERARLRALVTAP